MEYQYHFMDYRLLGMTFYYFFDVNYKKPTFYLTEQEGLIRL